jgi:hypothetical protein
VRTRTLWAARLPTPPALRGTPRRARPAHRWSAGSPGSGSRGRRSDSAAGHSSCVRAPGVPRRPAHTLGSSLRPVATSRHNTNSTGDITPRSPPDRDFRRSRELFLP